MKSLIILFTLTLSAQVCAQAFANKPMLGQDSDPVGGDNSRCCKTGACTSLKSCEDTQLGADRLNIKDSSLALQRNKGKKGSTSAQ